MKRSKNLFHRLYNFYASIILISLAVLQILTAIVSGYYFSQKQYNFLKARSETISSLISSNFSKYSGNYVNIEDLNSVFELMSSVSEIDIFLTDMNGKILYSVRYDNESNSSNRDYSNIGKVIEIKNLETFIENGNLNTLTKLNGTYENQYFLNASPVIYKGETMGVIFTTCSTKDFNLFLSKLFKSLLLCAIISTIIAFSFLIKATENLIKPIRNLAEVAKSFSIGDFSKRIPLGYGKELDMVAQSFNEMAETLSVSENSGRSFVANISHELKTPMTTISGFIDGILDGTIPKEKQDYYLKIVSEETKRLSRMVVSMLNISRIEAGEMTLNLQKVLLNDVIINTLLGFENKIDEKKLEILGLEEIQKTYVMADYDMLGQIIYNLIENAVKFTNDNGSITFKVKEESTEIRISIINTGDGISKEEIPLLFNRFYKSDKSRSKDKTGVGLGLHIVRTLINMHNGNLEVDSKINEYTNFTFTLPKPMKSSVPAILRKNQEEK